MKPNVEIWSMRRLTEDLAGEQVFKVLSYMVHATVN